MAVVIQQQLRRVGIRVEVTSIPDFATLVGRLVRYDYGLLSDTGFPRDDPSQILAFWQLGSPSNIFRGGFQDPELDRLIVAGRIQRNPEVRKGFYRKALELIQYENVATVMYAGEGDIWAYRTRLTGFTVGDRKRMHHSGGGIAYASVSN